MPNKLELAGQRFGMLSVLSEAGRDSHGAVMWNVRCDCGKETVARGSQLLSGVTASCGCGVRVVASLPRKHGKCKTPLFSVWMGMRDRCERPKNNAYRNYGGRGIKVCPRWRAFAAFAEDMEPGYQPGLEIDRIDNNGDYEPGNCRWATPAEQALNKRTTRFIDWRGERLPLQVWAERIGLKPNTLICRLRRGRPLDRAMTTTPRLLEIANR